MEQPVKILGFVGSLRKGSYNKALMRAAVALVPDNATIEVFDLAGIPRSIKTWKMSLRRS
jgi:chromate reductase